MKITNGSKALQGIWTGNDHVQIKPGESRDVELTEHAEAMARRLPFLSFEGAESADEKTSLIADLAELGIKSDRRWSVSKLTEALNEAQK